MRIYSWFLNLTSMSTLSLKNWKLKFAVTSNFTASFAKIKMESLIESFNQLRCWMLITEESTRWSFAISVLIQNLFCFWTNVFTKCLKIKLYSYIRIQNIQIANFANGNSFMIRTVFRYIIEINMKAVMFVDGWAEYYRKTKEQQISLCLKFLETGEGFMSIRRKSILFAIN